MTATVRTKRKAAYVKPESVKELERLADKKEFARYPNFFYPVPAKYRDDTAYGLMKCVIVWLKLHGCQAERINTTDRMIDERYNIDDVTVKTQKIGGIRWVFNTKTNGSAEISATIKGLSVKIAIKIGRDVQSDAERLYQSEVERAGGVYLIVHNFTEFLDWWNEKGSQIGSVPFDGRHLHV